MTFSVLLRAPTARAFRVGVILVGALGFSAVSLADGKVPLRFRGDWQGTLSDATFPASSGNVEWREPIELRIVITDEGAKLYRRTEERWEHLNSQVLKVAAAESNAFFYSIWSTNHWSATWSVGMSLIGTKHLHVAFTRQLHDKETNLRGPDAVKTSIAYGLLERISDESN